jgi:hypothetical protein
MNTIRRCALLAVLLVASACSSSPTTADNALQPSLNTAATDSGTTANRGGGNLMGGN